MSKLSFFFIMSSCDGERGARDGESGGVVEGDAGQSSQRRARF